MTNLDIIQVTTASVRDYVIQQNAVNTAGWNSLSKSGMSLPQLTFILTGLTYIVNLQPNPLCVCFRVLIDMQDKRFLQEDLGKGLHKLTISKVVKYFF